MRARISTRFGVGLVLVGFACPSAALAARQRMRACARVRVRACSCAHTCVRPNERAHAVMVLSQVLTISSSPHLHGLTTLVHLPSRARIQIYDICLPNRALPPHTAPEPRAPHPRP